MSLCVASVFSVLACSEGFLFTIHLQALCWIKRQAEALQPSLQPHRWDFPRGARTHPVPSLAAAPSRRWQRHCSSLCVLATEACFTYSEV